MTRPVPPLSVPSPDASQDALFDISLLLHVVGYMRRALRRHRRVAVTSFASCVAMAVLALLVMPRTYSTEATILAQKNLVMPALGNPRRAVPNESDAPTKLAAETVKKRENLIAIIKQTNLMVEYREQRAPIVRARDWVRDLVVGKMKPDEELDALVGLLDDRIWVETGDGGTVRIGVRWPNAEMAHRLVQTAQDNFIAERHGNEISLIGESIGILEGHVAATRLSIDSAFAELQRVSPRSMAPRPSGLSRVAPERDQELASLQALLAAKRQAINDLAAFHGRRVAELQATLTEQQRRYGANHPEIAKTRQALASAQIEPPQLEDLRREERTIAQNIVKKGGTPGVTVTAQQSSINQDFMSAARRLLPDSATGAEESFARGKLRLALTDYEDMLDRLNSARIELEIARAAFKYRFSVIEPVQVPRKADKPKPALLLAMGVILGIAMAFLVPVVLDLSRGRFLESWQVRTFTGLDVLGEVRSA